MRPSKPNSQASSEYDSAKTKALSAINAMTNYMKQMGSEHIEFHNNFVDVQKRLENMKNAYGKELDAEVIRATALDAYLSPGNVPKVMAFGHMQMEKALKDFEQEEMALGTLQNETAELVQALLGSRGSERGDGQGA